MAGAGANGMGDMRQAKISELKQGIALARADYMERVAASQHAA